MYVFNSKNTFAIFVTLGTVFLLPFIFWGYGEYFAVSNKQKSLSEQLKIWQSKQPSSYSYEIKFGCMEVSEVEVEVLNGQHFFSTGTAPGISHQVKLSDLFEIAEKVRAQSYKSDIRFDPTYGFPNEISVDWSTDSIDDECFYSVSSFGVYDS